MSGQNSYKSCLQKMLKFGWRRNTVFKMQVHCSFIAGSDQCCYKSSNPDLSQKISTHGWWQQPDNLSEIPLNQSYEVERVPAADHWSKSVETITCGGWIWAGWIPGGMSGRLLIQKCWRKVESSSLPCHLSVPPLPHIAPHQTKSNDATNTITSNQTQNFWLDLAMLPEHCSVY